MNGDLALLERFERAFVDRFGRIRDVQKGIGGVGFALAVPDLLLYPAQGILAGTPIQIGIQTCSKHVAGAHTGETSAQLAADLGASFVLIGHCERRQDHQESSELVYHQGEAAQACGLTPIICVGETLAERQAGKAVEVVLTQIQQSCPKSGPYHIAYEPIWAIGTGKVARAQDAQEMHGAIRSYLRDLSTSYRGGKILYGGSMKPGNAAELLAQPDIDGGLIGGASLHPEELLAIYDACS